MPQWKSQLKILLIEKSDDCFKAPNASFDMKTLIFLKRSDLGNEHVTQSNEESKNLII